LGGRVDLVDLLGNLGGARGVEEVRRHVDHVGDLREIEARLECHIIGVSHHNKGV